MTNRSKRYIKRGGPSTKFGAFSSFRWSGTFFPAQPPVAPSLIKRKSMRGIAKPIEFWTTGKPVGGPDRRIKLFPNGKVQRSER